MRVLSMIVLMTLFGASAVLLGEAQQENWSRCNSDDPDRKIGGCSAVIQSGQETGTNLANAFRGRGSAYAHKGDYDRAFQDYDQALRLNPSYAHGFFGRGLVYEHKGDIDYAISDSDKAIRLNPCLASAFYERGMSTLLRAER
jgi:tetratricopeptide (TPR) repeat protein